MQTDPLTKTVRRNRGKETRRIVTKNGGWFGHRSPWEQRYEGVYYKEEGERRKAV